LPTLFKPFTQEEQGYTRKFDGNGLGLALVKRYCELNDAIIKVHSKKDEGTKFNVKFFKTNKKNEYNTKKEFKNE
jgi:signal transduction histidine kinase